MPAKKTSISKKAGYWRLRLLIALSVIGPGIITGTADNDAGGVATYSIAGAHFGYQMLWMLILIIGMLYVTQEMGARLGVVTGKGLGDLIREKFGIRTSVLLIVLVFLANFSNIVADVAGVASVADIYNIPRLIFVPLFIMLLWYILLRGSFNFVQNIFLTSSVLFFCYIVNGFIAKPDVAAMIHGSFIPTLPMNKDYIFTATAMIGTTLTVWGQFFVQSYFVDKGVDRKHLRMARLDVLFGAVWCGLVAFFIMISAASTIFPLGLKINSASDMAIALEPLLGNFAMHLFSWGLLNASLLGICVISMGTAYAITEILGNERKVNASFGEAPLFYSLIGSCLLASVVIVLIPNIPVIFILTASQALNTIILPFIFFFLLKLMNDKKLLGSYANNMTTNIVSWITILCFTGISFLMLYLMFF